MTSISDMIVIGWSTWRGLHVWNYVNKADLVPNCKFHAEKETVDMPDFHVWKAPDSWENSSVIFRSETFSSAALFSWKQVYMWTVAVYFFDAGCALKLVFHELFHLGNSYFMSSFKSLVNCFVSYDMNYDIFRVYLNSTKFLTSWL